MLDSLLRSSIHDDATALHQEFASDLYRIASRLKVIQTVEIKGNGETLYEPCPVRISF